MIGQILDASAVDALVGDNVRATSWMLAARLGSIPWYVPAMAMGEVEAVRPYRREALWDLLSHPSVMRKGFDPSIAQQVEALLDRTGLFDACAGHVVVAARDRGWPVLTADPTRLQRIDPDVDTVAV